MKWIILPPSAASFQAESPEETDREGAHGFIEQIMKRSTYIKGALALLLILFIVFAQYQWNIAALLKPSRMKEIIENAGHWAPVVYLALMAVTCVIPLPGFPLYVIAGDFFGLLPGTIYSVLGLMVGGVASFLIARFLGRDMIEGFFGRRIILCEECSDRLLTKIVFVSRLLPFVSFDIVSYGAGLTRMTLKNFCAATFLGTVPLTFIYNTFGYYISINTRTTLISGLVIVSALFILPLLIEKYNLLSLKKYIPHMDTHSHPAGSGGDRIAPREAMPVKQGIHAYPLDLVSFIFDQWKEPFFAERLRSAGIDLAFQLPDRYVLDQVVSTCYQASLMREEERTIVFRLIMGAPDLFPGDEGPPSGLHRLLFTKPLPFNETELHRIAPAADFSRTLIGIFPDREKGMQIWGLIHSGTRWMQTVHGGRKTFPPLPPCFVIYVTGPGQLSVCLGPEMIASLSGGLIKNPYPDIFTAKWLMESFADVRSEMRDLHEKARARTEKPWATLDPEFGKNVAQQAVRRIISLIRNSHHGGILVYLPPEMAHEISDENRYMILKYPFREDEPRQRFRTLMLRIMNTLSEMYGDPENAERVIGWQEYVTCRSETIALLDEAFFDLAHFIAALSATDGAVVMTKRGELLGFGGLISGDIKKVGTIHRALDIEGNITEPELSEGVGTRHRAAYRLCHELHDALVIVISQDGYVRFVKWQNDSVTYWDQAPTGVPGF